MLGLCWTEAKTRGLDFLLGYPGSSVCSAVPGQGWVSIARQTEDLFSSRTRWATAVSVKIGFLEKGIFKVFGRDSICPKKNMQF